MLRVAGIRNKTVMGCLLWNSCRQQSVQQLPLSQEHQHSSSVAVTASAATTIALLLLLCMLVSPSTCHREEAVNVATADGQRHNVPVLVPDSYHTIGEDSSGPRPTAVVLILHGFCTPAANQEWLSLFGPTGLFDHREPSAYTQAGWADLVDGSSSRNIGQTQAVLNPEGPSSIGRIPPFLYVMPPAPRSTRVCALCRGEGSVDDGRDAVFPYAGAMSAIFTDAVALLPGGGCPAWKASDTCCRLDDTETTAQDDVAYVRQVMGIIQTTYNVDTQRQYLLGIGNGGFMALRLACDIPEMFAAIASFGGAGSDENRECTNTAQTHVLEIHATGDPFVPYRGSINVDGTPFPAASTTVAMLAEHQGCRNADTSAFNLPTPYSKLAVPVQVTEYKACAGEGSVSHWNISEGGHFLPRETVGALWARTAHWFAGHPSALTSKQEQQELERPNIFNYNVSLPSLIRLVVDAVRRIVRFLPGFRREGEQTQSSCPMVTSTVNFANLGITTLTNAQTSAAFQRSLRAQMAEAAHISESDISINSIIPSPSTGVDITSTVYFCEALLSTEDSAPHQFGRMLKETPGDVFSRMVESYKPIRSRDILLGDQEGFIQRF